jgi:membrane associated rhomboid family serine protease
MKTEFRPGSFQILPTIIKNLLIINGLVFLAQLIYDGIQPGSDLEPQIGALTNTFALHSIESPLFKPWQVLTHIFMHGSFTHILSNMFALWMFGSILENVWGPKRFLMFYLICGLGAAGLYLASLSWEYHGMVSAYNAFARNPSELTFNNLINNQALSAQMSPHEGLMLTRNWAADPQVLRQNSAAILEIMHNAIVENANIPTLGASGAVFGCLAAFGYLFPNTYVYLYFFLPVKAKWFVLGYIALELVMVLRHSGGGIARWAHLGGALVGFLMVFFWNRTNRRSFY